MTKRVIECAECGNGFTIYTTCKEDIGYCPFCGEPLLLEAPELDEDEDDSPFDEDEDWPESGC
jgi:rRNA maturation endonuclease Nob1